MARGLAEERFGGESDGAARLGGRALMIAVVVMGVLILVGAAGLIGVIAHRALGGGALGGGALGSGAHPAAASRLALPLAPGERVTAVTSRPDGALAVTLSGERGSRVLLWSPEGGRLIAELDLGAP